MISDPLVFLSSPLRPDRCHDVPIGSERTIPLMCSKIVQVIPPPATLGGRSANASHRLSAFLHSLHLVTGDFDVLGQLLSRLVSITTDLGVESLLTKLEPFSLHEMLPFFEPPAAAARPCDDAEDGFVVIPEQDNGEGQEDEAMFAVRPESSLDVMAPNADAASQAPADSTDPSNTSLQACRGVGGLLHIIHNAFKDLGSCMSHYEEQVSNMAVLSKFLSERHSKERLIAKCFSEGLPAEAPFKFAVQTFSSQCYRPRWGTVAKCSLDLQKVLPALRHGWSMDKYLDGGNAASASKEGTSIEQVDRLVRCHFFEAYLIVLSCFAKLTLHLVAWSESCPCHWHLLTAGGAAAMEPSVRRLLESCPMRGRRAPELAMNGFMAELAAFSSRSAASLAQRFPCDLPDDSRSCIVHDFELGRSFLTSVLAMKTSHFRSFPFKLAALAFHDQERAREVWSCVRDIFGEGDTQEADMLRKHAPRLFKPHVMQQADQWYFGADMMSCSDFAAEVASLALAPTAERRVESQHARTQKGSKKSPCHSPAYMSLQIRSKDLRSEVCQDPKAFVSRLAPCVHQCRSYRKAAERMRLGLHPAVRNPLSRKQVRCRTVRDALYRADMLSQHQEMPDVFVRASQTKPQAAQPLADQPDEASPLGRLLHQLALEHVMTRLDEVQASVENPSESLVFAVSYQSEAFSFLREFLLPSQEKQPMPMLKFQAEEAMECEAIVVRPASSASSSMDVLFQKLSLAESCDQRLSGVFFKLLPSMSRMKRFQGEGERRMCGTDLPIALVRPVSYDRSSQAVLVDTELLSMRSVVQGLSMDEIPCVMSISSMSLSQLKTLGVCKVEPNIVYCLRAFSDIPPALHDSEALRCVLKSICVRGKSGLGDVSGFSCAEKTILDALQAGDFITREMPLKLTEKGLTYVCFAKKVFDPKRLLVKVDVPPPEQSKWQLLQALLDQQWEVQVVKQTDCRKAAPFKVTDEDPAKIMYLTQTKSGIMCARLYLLALTMAAEHGQEVPHGRPNKEYVGILQGVAPLALPAPRESAGFRAIADGDDWLDSDPAPPPPKKRKKHALQRAATQPLCDVPPLDIMSANHIDGVAAAVAEPSADESDGQSVISVNALEHMLQELVTSDEELPEGAENADAVLGASDPHAHVPTSPESDSSTTSASSSDSSSSSSSSDSSSSSGSHAAAKPKAKSKARPKPKPKSRAAASASGGGDGGRGGGGGELLESTFFWRDCKFTAVRDNEFRTIGYEATCRHVSSHGKGCRRTLKFSRHGGREQTLLRLKWWLLQARHYTTKEQRVRECPYEITAPQPTEEDLETMDFGF